jgi:hypothetical protein
MVTGVDSAPGRGEAFVRSTDERRLFGSVNMGISSKPHALSGCLCGGGSIRSCDTLMTQVAAHFRSGRGWRARVRGVGSVVALVAHRLPTNGQAGPGSGVILPMTTRLNYVVDRHVLVIGARRIHMEVRGG